MCIEIDILNWENRNEEENKKTKTYQEGNGKENTATHQQRNKWGI